MGFLLVSDLHGRPDRALWITAVFDRRRRAGGGQQKGEAEREKGARIGYYFFGLESPLESLEGDNN